MLVTLNTDLSGGPLGGDGDFTKHVLELGWRVPIGLSQAEGSQPGGPRFALGLGIKTGVITGDPSAFPLERYFMGGVQFGEILRGYDETSITPRGYFPDGSRAIPDADRLGDAFLKISADFLMVFGDNIGLSFFYDAGGLWNSPAEIDPSKLFRGAGVGIQVVTPFGPIGFDYAYGFDKTTPGFQFHFRMGPGF